MCATYLDKFPPSGFLGLQEGVYLVGTGDTGAAKTFFTLGTAYCTLMMAGALNYRIPSADWSPKNWKPPIENSHAAANAPNHSSSLVTKEDVHIDTALKTPQFWLLWSCLCFNVSAGIGVIGVAKTMMSDIFGSTLPSVVDTAFAATYVSMISVFNMVGRIGWASASDLLGRKNTYYMFFGCGIPLYLSIPWAAQWVSADPSLAPLLLFYGSSMLIFSMYGGGFATIPAYLADLFGTKYVGGIHGRLLTAWSTAGVMGPVAITHLRDQALHNALEDLTLKVDDESFARAFGTGKDNLQELITSHTVTIDKLLAMAPEGTLDPTPSLYNSTMYSMAGLLGMGFLANSRVKPVDPKFWLKNEQRKA